MEFHDLVEMSSRFCDRDRQMIIRPYLIVATATILRGSLDTYDTSAWFHKKNALESCVEWAVLELN